MQYIIKGDSKNFKNCLVFVIGHCTEEYAKSVLNRVKNNPTDNDKRVTKGLSNLRIEEVTEEDCWWDGV